jgi:dTDP-4-amino-4,6-dideoxygalactose transaminase
MTYASVEGRPTRALSDVEGLLREHFPRQPYIYFGVSGTTLLHEALKSQSRTCVVLPGFICANVSAAAARSGKQTIHIDADQRTQLPDIAQLHRCVESLDASDTAILIDHSFGNPFPALANVRSKFPQLLIIEDCARALGAQVDGKNPGEHSDWTLLSMYKTIPGCIHGAVLLSVSPLSMPQTERTATTFRELVSKVKPLRSIYRGLQRVGSHELKSRVCEVSNFPEWTPSYGSPNNLCLSRFAAELKNLHSQARIRRAIAEELTDGLSQAGIDCIKVAEGCRSAGHFVSFQIPQQHKRDQLLSRLRKQGLPIGLSWDIVSAHYRDFQHTFLAGRFNSEYLAERMVHIRVPLFATKKVRQHLLNQLHGLTSAGVQPVTSE